MGILYSVFYLLIDLLTGESVNMPSYNYPIMDNV